MRTWVTTWVITWVTTNVSALSALASGTAGRHLLLALAAILLLLPASTPAAADDSKLSDQQRQQIIRAFLAEHPFVHRALPRGKAGVRIEGDKITPSEAELSQMVNQFGVAAKPGDRARITAVHFIHHAIVFDINGGPVKRKSWKDRVAVGVGGVDVSKSGQQSDQPGQQPDDPIYNNATGSSVTLVFKDDASSLTTDHIKELLSPVLDFKAMTMAEAYQKSLPPKLAEAVKNHKALVGMDKEMVTCALGRPPRRVRETENGQDYEEWIYGAPPKDVQFIRFVGDKAVQIEDMSVSGQKRIRTEDEVGDLTGALDASAPKHTRPDAAAEDEQRSAPTLLRPGEQQVKEQDATRDPRPMPPPDSPNAPQTPGPN